MEPRVEERNTASISVVRLILAAAALGTLLVVSDGWLLGDRIDGPAVSAATEPLPETGHLQLHLTTDGPSVEEIVEVVRAQARQVPGARPDAPVKLVLTPDVAAESGDERELLAGLQRGDTAWVRSDGGWPEGTVVHEVAHVLTDGDGHGEMWRAVYLGAIEELFGAARAAREQRRIAWVYDRCYLDDSCPERDDAPEMSGASASAHHHTEGDGTWQPSR